MAISIKEIRQKSKKELISLYWEEKEKIRKLRFLESEGKLRRNHLLSEKRKTIAQINTVLKDKTV